MAIKTIIDVEIDKDGEFARFKELFDKYSEKLDENPNKWKAVSDEIGTTNVHLSHIVDLIQDQTDAITGLHGEQQKSERTVQKSATLWEKISKDAKSVRQSVLETTNSILKWSAGLGLLSGIVGGGSLFGLDRMAVSVGASRRSAQGLGLTIGEQEGFEVTAGRLVDPHKFLSGVNEALTDVSQRHALYGAGLSEAQISGHTPAQVADETLRTLKRLADNTDPPFLAQTIQARGIESLVSAEDLQRLKKTSPEEFESILAQEAGNRRALGVKDDVARAWQDLGVQFEVSWGRIEKSFVNGLVGLAEPIAHVSAAVSDMLTAFMHSDQLKIWFDELGEGIEHFSRYLSSQDFTDDTNRFFAEVKKLADGAGRLADWLGITNPNSVSAGYPASPDQAKLQTGTDYDLIDSWKKLGGTLDDIPKNISDAMKRAIDASNEPDDVKLAKRTEIDKHTETTRDFDPRLPEKTLWDRYKNWRDDNFHKFYDTPTRTPHAADWSDPRASVPPVADTADVSPEDKALLDVIAGPESGGKNVRFTGKPGGEPILDTSQHPGISERIPDGWSHAGETSNAAGPWQMLKSTWDFASKLAGVHDFTVESQAKAARALAEFTYRQKTGRDLETDLAAGKTDLLAGALKSQWGSFTDTSVDKLTRLLGKLHSMPQKTSVEINNNTGGNVITSVGQIPRWA